MDAPSNLAQAVAAWAAIERHLIRHCGLLDSSRLDTERPALIRLMAEALAGVPAMPAPAERYDPTLALPAQVIPHRPIGTPVWIGTDLPNPFPRPDGPGFSCRGCGRRQRGARHADPRLLCDVCIPKAVQPYSR